MAFFYDCKSGLTRSCKIFVALLTKKSLLFTKGGGDNYLFFNVKISGFFSLFSWAKVAFFCDIIQCKNYPFFSDFFKVKNCFFFIYCLKVKIGLFFPIKNYHRWKTSCLFTFPSFKIIKSIDIAKINFQFLFGVFTLKIGFYIKKRKVVCAILGHPLY